MTLDDIVRDKDAITRQMIAAQGVLSYLESAIKLHVRDAAQTEANARAAALIIPEPEVNDGS